MLCQMWLQESPQAESIKPLWHRFSITWSTPETTPSPVPTIHFTRANLAVKVNHRREQPRVRQERCRTPHGRLAADLLDGGCVPAVPFSSCKILWSGNASNCKCIHHPEQQDLSFGSSLWASALMEVNLITKISLKGPGTRACFASLRIIFDYQPLVINY